MLKRAFDIIMCSISVVILAIPMLIIAILIKTSSPGPVLFWSDRVGRNNKIFKMPKFRTMRIDAPVVATHLLDDPQRYVTRIGRFLRRSSADEFPQIFTIIRGHMSIVGPRPALYNQHDLIEMRTAKGVHTLRPGLTGYAQILGRDEIPIEQKVALDEEYMQKQTFALDLKIIGETMARVFRPRNVSH